MTFGQWLLSKRKSLGLTQGQLAQKAGISTSYVSTLERNQRHAISDVPPRPAPDVVEALAKALRVPIDEARLEAGYAPLEPLANGFFKGLDKLSPERQELAKRQIRAIIDSLAEEEHDTDYIDDEPGT